MPGGAPTISAKGDLMAQHSLLVVGGGIAGMSLALRMRERGWKVDLVESDPQWRVYGAWMYAHDLLKQRPRTTMAFTNDLLPGAGL